MEARERAVSGRCPAGRGHLSPERTLQVFRAVKSVGKLLGRLALLFSATHLLAFAVKILHQVGATSRNRIKSANGTT